MSCEGKCGGCKPKPEYKSPYDRLYAKLDVIHTELDGDASLLLDAVTQCIQEVTGEFGDEMIWEIAEDLPAKDIFGKDVVKIAELSRDLYCCISQLDEAIYQYNEKKKKSNG